MNQIKVDAAREIRYRSDIDGLRAIAVTSVILSHAGFGAFEAGIVGVDVFFVISGFLITGIILRQQSRGEFNLWNFYDRRIRRILPALAFVLMLLTLVAWVLQLPLEFKRLGQSLVSVATFSSNFYFYLTTDYFSPAAELQPLLHTWSLAVEEQYYVFYPLLLMFLFKIRSTQTLQVLVGLMAVSFLAWIVVHQFNPSFAFYMLPTRGWQLLLGAVIAVHFAQAGGEPTRRTPRLDMLGMLGVVIILVAVFGVAAEEQGSQAVLFQSALAAAGSALVIACSRPGSPSYQLLSLRPVVFIGLISYSAYLWHQPVFALYRQVSLNEPTTTAMIILIGVVFLLSVVSWKYVEEVFRDRRRMKLARVAWIVAPCFAAFFAVGLVAHVLKGEVGRYSGAVAATLENLNVSLVCEGKRGDSEPKVGCPVGSPEVTPSFVVWGDSHSRSFAQGIDSLGKNGLSVAGLVYTMPGCPSVMGVYRAQDDKDGLSCIDFNQLAFDHIVDSAVDRVVLVSRWPMTVDSSRFDNGLGGKEHGTRIVVGDRQAQEFSTPEQRINYFETALRSTVVDLQQAGKQVMILLTWPEIGWDVPNYAMHDWRFGRTDNLKLNPPVLPREIVERRQRNAFAAIRRATADLDVALVDASPAFCDGESCRSGDEQELWYWDDDHLSVAGIRRLLARTDLAEKLGIGPTAHLGL